MTYFRTEIRGYGTTWEWRVVDTTGQVWEQGKQVSEVLARAQGNISRFVLEEQDPLMDPWHE
jgi:hypothetical protein